MARMGHLPRGTGNFRPGNYGGLQSEASAFKDAAQEDFAAFGDCAALAGLDRDSLPRRKLIGGW